MADNKYQIGVDISASGVKELAKEFEAIAPAVENTRKAFVQLPKDIDRASKSMDGVVTPAQKTSGAFVQLPANVERAAKAFKELANPVKQTEAAVTRLPEAVKKTTQELSKLRPGANQAGAAVINLGRVLQDAPFGFIGIANNLNPLLESFQRLQKETGSTSKTLKALGSSLIGAGGIGLALSAVTFIMSGGIETIKKFFAQFNDANAAISKTKEFISEIRKISDIRIDAAGSVQGEIQQVQSLIKVVQDETKSKQQRLNAIEALKKVNKEYFGDLSLEQKSLASLTKIQEEYTQALVAQAVVKGLTDEISKVSTELFKNERSLRQAGAAVDAAQKKYDALRLAAKQSADALRGSDRGINASASSTRQEEAAAKARTELDKLNKTFYQQYDITQQLRGSYATLNEDLDTQVSLATQLKSLQGSGGTSSETIDQLKKQLEVLNKIRTVQKKLYDEAVAGSVAQQEAATSLVKTEEKIFELNVKITLRDAKKNGIPKEEVDELVKSYEKQLSDALLLQAIAFEATARVKPIVDFTLAEYPDTSEVNSKIAKALGIDKDIKLPAKGTVQLQAVGLDTRTAIENLAVLKDAFLKNVDDIINQSLASAAIAVGEGIGNVFSGGGLKSLFAPLLGVIGQALTELGKAVIAYGIAMEAIQEALKNAFESPYIAIAAGIAAVAAGQILKNKAQKSSQKFEGGGIATGPSSGYQVTLHGTEAIVPLKNSRYPFGVAGGGQPQELFAVIRGKDLYLSNQRTSNSRRRI